ncbi:hypothetical protein LNKW23_44240 [Paralimibaculum aggregatum]|uniref:Uncharacterized protein n=1 Tax=Paralimibaculum aggregatum TaxID=3036245 RepID=A0ABQ6LSZ3_9RHOB|nr:hypothetical protein [Limibaculum sp. NKW23]GMG85208.1 hypothetical protein LNKW23_44240 [Limibaculum sp. NKW23]
MGRIERVRVADREAAARVDRIAIAYDDDRRHITRRHRDAGRIGAVPDSAAEALAPGAGAAVAERDRIAQAHRPRPAEMVAARAPAREAPVKPDLLRDRVRAQGGDAIGEPGQVGDADVFQPVLRGQAVPCPGAVEEIGRRGYGHGHGVGAVDLADETLPADIEDTGRGPVRPACRPARVLALVDGDGRHRKTRPDRGRVFRAPERGIETAPVTVAPALSPAMIVSSIRWAASVVTPAMPSAS